MEPVLKSSIHSSFALYDVPLQATSLISTLPGGTAVPGGGVEALAVGVVVGVVVGDAVLVVVPVGVAVGDGEEVAVDVPVAVVVGLGDGEQLGVEDGVGDGTAAVPSGVLVGFACKAG